MKKTLCNSKNAIVLFAIITQIFISKSVLAQLVERPAMSFRGQYDIKMVSSQGLQAAWVSAVNPFQVLRPLTTDEMRAESYYLGINNSVSVGGPNGYYSSTNQGFLNVKPVEALGAAMVYADCDDDMNTFQSSAAYLGFESDNACSTIEAAYLYWNGMTDVVNVSNYAAYPGLPTMKSNAGGAIGSLSGTAYRTIKFKAPGDVNYSNVTSQRQLETYGSERYICFADVTNLVKGKSRGLYWVGNIRTASGKMAGGATSAWTLVVLYKNQNCPPRTIKFWDGMVEISSGYHAEIDFAFNPGDIPATVNSKSYLGVAVLDGENSGAYLKYNSYDSPEFLEFSSMPGGQTYKINPFATGQTHHPEEEQPAVPVWDRDGMYLGTAYEGFSCSRITSWSEEKGTNGNEIIRIPSQQNTLGYDAHHIKLPSGAIVPGASSARMTYYAGPQGGTTPFMAYMAIEAARPILKMSLRADGIQKVKPGEDLSYILTIENTGAAALPAGAYILDTLDKSVDFVPSSVQNLRGSEPITSEISNQGSDVDEALKLYIPALAAGDGTTPTDSAVIRFTVKVKDLSRMDIWNLICHRVVRNRAIAYYQDINANEYTAVTNSPSACGVSPEYLDVYVDDPAITQQHLITHYINDTIYEQLLLASQAGTPVKIDSLARTYLEARLASIGRSPSEASQYTLLDENGLPVSPSAVFAFDESNQKFIAELDLGQGCIESFNFEFIIAPSISNLVIQKPSCIGLSDGKISFTVSRGNPRYTCILTDSVDESKIIYQSIAPAASSSSDFEIANLPAGTYKIYAGDQGALSAVQTVRLLDPDTLSVRISAPDSLCVNLQASLEAKVSGRTTPLSYVWESSTDSVTWVVEHSSSNVSTISSTISEDKYFAVYVCDNHCETVAVKKIVADASLNCNTKTTDIIEAGFSSMIYPNPAKEGFYIHSGKLNNQVKIYNMKGDLMLRTVVADESYISIKDFVMGTYIVDLNSQKMKLIKQ